jgi:relaxase-like protein
VIAKGTPHDNGVRLARYLTTGKEGEIAALWELSGFASTDIVEAFRSVHVMAAGTRCLQPFFHVQVRNPDTEFLTRDQWLIVADRIERVLGLAGQPRALAFHKDRQTGGEHMHLAFSRIDHENLTARKLSFFKRRLNMVSRELETLLGLTPVSTRRTSAITYAPLRPQEEQARRLGVDIREVLETVREYFDRSDCGRSFVAALTHSNLTLAQGERRDFVVVDHAGGIHALGKRILGVSAAQIRARLSDLATESLPTVEQVRQRITVRLGSRKRAAVGKGHDARRKQEKLPAPAIESTPPSIKTLEAMEDQPDWTARPTFPVPSVAQHEPALPEYLPPPNREIAHEISACEFDEAKMAPLPPGAVPLTVTDLATNRPEPEVEPPPIARGTCARLTDVLKKQFRAVVQALVKRTPSPRTQARRRRGETVGGFRSAARSLLRPIIRLPGVSQTIAFLHDTIPWLHLWDWNETAEHDITAEPVGTEGNPLSPHP